MYLSESILDTKQEKEIKVMKIKANVPILFKPTGHLPQGRR